MKKMVDIIVVGFAIFSMFFGAGNLIFPPYTNPTTQVVILAILTTS